MYLHTNIKHLRKQDRESQEVWGKKFDLTRGMVDSYERQIAKPNTEAAQKICKYYKITLDELFNKDIDGRVENPNELLKAKDDLIKSQQGMIDLLQETIKRLQGE